MTADRVALCQAEIQIIILAQLQCLVETADLNKRIPPEQYACQHPNQIALQKSDVRISRYWTVVIRFTNFTVLHNVAMRAVDESAVGMFGSAVQTGFESPWKQTIVRVQENDIARCTIAKPSIARSRSSAILLANETHTGKIRNDSSGIVGRPIVYNDNFVSRTSLGQDTRDRGARIDSGYRQE